MFRLLANIALIIIIVFNGFFCYSQCTVSISSNSNQIICGQSVNFLATGYSGLPVMSNNFDLGNAGSGWNTSTSATFTNPCGPGNGSSYLWMGDNSPAPRSLSTIGFDLSCGAEICFDLRFAIQGGTSPCEGPDLWDEGVDLMYSIDNGLTWISIFYFEPNTTTNAYTTWQNYCFTLPPAAQTTNTMIGWFQNASTSLIYDHWGLDNVTIQAFDCNYYYVWNHNGSGNPSQSATITTDSTFTVLYTNGINDSCWATIPITVLFPTVTIDPVDSIYCQGDTILNAVLSNIPADSCCYTLQMDDNFGDGWSGGYVTVFANLTSLGQFFASGYGTTVQICFANGDQIRLLYTAGNGPFAYEIDNSYTFYDPNMTVLYSANPPPPIGTVYTGFANCGPPVTYNYQWSPSNLVLSPNSATTQTTTLPQGTYNFTVTVTNASNPNCFTTDTITIIVSGSINTVGIFHN